MGKIGGDQWLKSQRASSTFDQEKLKNIFRNLSPAQTAAKLKKIAEKGMDNTTEALKIAKDLQAKIDEVWGKATAPERKALDDATQAWGKVLTELGASFAFTMPKDAPPSPKDAPKIAPVVAKPVQPKPIPAPEDKPKLTIAPKPAPAPEDKPKSIAKPAPASKPAPAKTASQELEELAEMFDGAEREEMLKTARAMREVEEIVRLAAEIRNLGLGAFANTMDDLAALMGD